jgi:DegV family protein with EDD domain
MTVRVVTDSTAYLPTEVATSAKLRVVPLTVTVSGREGREGLDVTPADVAKALGERRISVTTSRPSPAAFALAYRELLDDGASGIVSVHLSSRLSGTYAAATKAAEEFDGRVRVVDSATAGMGVGLIALAAADAARSGADLAAAEAAAVAAASQTSTFFYVDTLEFLRRGGRIGAAAALLGTALSVKPILYVVAGEVVLKEKVRTSARALARLAELAAEIAGESDVDIAVQHLAAHERAEALRASLAKRLGSKVRSEYVLEIGAVVAAHTGPGVIGVALRRRSPAGDGEGQLRVDVRVDSGDRGHRGSGDGGGTAVAAKGRHRGSGEGGAPR